MRFTTDQKIGLAGLIVGIFACIGTYLAIPEIREVFRQFSYSQKVVQPNPTNIPISISMPTYVEPTATPTRNSGVTGPTPAPSMPATPMPPTSTVSDQVGTIKWEIKEYSTNQVLGQGNSIILKKDVRIEKRTAQDGTAFYNGHIVLGNNFAFGLSIFPANNLDGFGMWLERTDQGTFSWDWFNIKDSQIADKLQWGGQLAYSKKLVNSNWEITRTEFLTDIVLRADPSGIQIDPNKPKWIATIYKGSYINWPSHE